mgnify:CR=1 FL=1
MTNDGDIMDDEDDEIKLVINYIMNSPEGLNIYFILWSFIYTYIHVYISISYTNLHCIFIFSVQHFINLHDIYFISAISKLSQPHSLRGWSCIHLFFRP